MKLPVKILLIALLNLGLLFAAFTLGLRLLLREDFDSFLLGPARDRILAVSQGLALELAETPESKRSELLRRYTSRFGVSFHLFENEGTQLGGPPVQLPEIVAERLSRPRPPVRRPPGPPPGFEAPPLMEPRTGQPRVPGVMFLENAGGQYWIGIRIPVRSADQPAIVRGTLILTADSLVRSQFFLDYRPLVAVVLGVVAICVICWLPLIRGLTHSIAEMNRATEQIAEGRFNVHVKQNRSDELGRLSAAINRMADRLSGFVTGQKRFLGDIAHELCSPIARIQFAIGILEQRSGDAAQPYVEELRDEVQHMSGLVNELLSFSKAGMQPAPVDLKPVDVAQSVRRVLDREAPGQIEARIANGLHALANAEYFERALANLVRNSVRYAGGAGPIAVAGHAENGQVVVTITDSGPGVPESELDRIFSPFYRPEPSRNRETGGVGLGLAIVKSCADACDAKVSCRNRTPCGFEVTIRFGAAS